MKRPVIQAFCDWAHSEHGELVPADHVDVPLTFGDETVWLDLSQAGYELVRKTLDGFMTLGRRETEGRRVKPGARDHYARLREFAKARNINYTTPGGSFYYTEELKRLFAEHEAQGADP